MPTCLHSPSLCPGLSQDGSSRLIRRLVCSSICMHTNQLCCTIIIHMCCVLVYEVHILVVGLAVGESG